MNEAPSAPRGKRAHSLACPGPISEAAALDVATADDKVDVRRCQGMQHAREETLIVLQVGVNDGYGIRTGRQRALNDR